MSCAAIVYAYTASVTPATAKPAPTSMAQAGRRNRPGSPTAASKVTMATPNSGYANATKSAIRGACGNDGEIATCQPIVPMPRASRPASSSPRMFRRWPVLPMPTRIAGIANTYEAR